MKKERLILSVFFVVLMVFLSVNVNADIISVNSGGTGNVILNPDKYIEAFFFGDEDAVTFCGDGIVQNPNDQGGAEQCDDGNIINGDGCSSTCQTETTGGGGGGGGGTPAVNIEVEPTQFNINLEVNTNVERVVTVTNLGTSSQTLTISQQDLDNRVIINETSLNIPGGQSRAFSVIFVATNQTGIFAGKIFVENEEILVSLNVQSELLLFDSNIVVLNENFRVPQGSDLETLVTLIPFGSDPRLDVTLDFTIRDYTNNIYLTKSETILVTEQVDMRRNFDTGNLPLGDYIIGLELIYPNGVAPSSAYFEVVEKEPLNLFGRIVLFLVILILLILIAIIVVLIKRKLDERKQQTGSYF